MDRVLSKEDELFAKKDFDGAERLLKYWYDEAERNGDATGEFQLANELMGLYRKLGRGPEAIAAA